MPLHQVGLGRGNGELPPTDRDDGRSADGALSSNADGKREREPRHASREVTSM